MKTRETCYMTYTMLMMFMMYLLFMVIMMYLLFMSVKSKPDQCDQINYFRYL